MTIRTTGLKVKSSIRAGRLSSNHNRLPLHVRAGIKAGKLASNQARAPLALAPAA